MPLRVVVFGKFNKHSSQSRASVIAMIQIALTLINFYTREEKTKKKKDKKQKNNLKLFQGAGTAGHTAVTPQNT